MLQVSGSAFKYFCFFSNDLDTLLSVYAQALKFRFKLDSGIYAEHQDFARKPGLTCTSKTRQEIEDQTIRKKTTQSPLFIEIQWFPVSQRIGFFKILLLTFKALNGLAPTYITDVLD